MGEMESQPMQYALIILLVFMIHPSTQNAFELVERAAHDPAKIRNQLLIDLDLVKNSTKKLQGSVDNLASCLNSQGEVIHSLKLHFSLNENAIDKCEMEASFYGIDSKLVKIKQTIQQVLHDNDDHHMDDIGAIMHNVRKSSYECSMDGRELFAVFQANITSKLEEFDRQMERLNALERRLIKSDREEMKTNETNAALTKLLKEINRKLKTQEQKLGKLESFLPLMVNASQSLTAFKDNERTVCNKEKCISQKILELTNGQGGTKGHQ